VAHLLVVEGESGLRRALVEAFESDGHTAEAAEDGLPALFAHLHRPADLIVLALRLPYLDGYQVLGHLRARNDPVPVLLLTGPGADGERLKGLNLGADDCLGKPPCLPELTARVKAILRRSRAPANPRMVLSGPFRFDFQALTATRDGLSLDLTYRELRILEALVGHAGRTRTRQDLLALAWDPDALPSPRTVDVHIANLRRKLSDGTFSHLITTVPGEGYRWTG